MSIQFKKFPCFLFSDFRDLSSDAKILYAVLSDRKTLSEKNGLKDDNGTYVIFTVKEVDKYVPSSKGKASKLMKELRDCGLISRKRMGQGKADRIYVTDYAEESSPVSDADKDLDACKGIEEDRTSSENDKSEPRCSFNETLKLTFSAPIKTNDIYTDIDNPSVFERNTGCTRDAGRDRTDTIPLYINRDNDPVEKVLENTGLNDMPDDPVNELLIDVIGEVMSGSGSELIRINGSEKPKNVVRSCFMKLDRNTIQHFIYRLVHHADLRTVKNKRSYVRSMLYNSYFESMFRDEPHLKYGT